jgi:hypothetical protein
MSERDGSAAIAEAAVKDEHQGNRQIGLVGGGNVELVGALPAVNGQTALGVGRGERGETCGNE